MDVRYYSSLQLVVKLSEKLLFLCLPDRAAYVDGRGLWRIMDKTAIIEKVRKLLALSNSCNEHEAALAARHVQRLLSEHNLAMSDIEASVENSAADRVELSAARNLPKWVRALSGGIGSAFDCQVLHMPSRGNLVFIGVGADPEVASYTFTYLERTVRRLCASYLKSMSDSSCSKRQRELARQSYYLGAVSAISGNLREQKQQTPITPNALVPVKDALIRAAMQEMGPIRTVHSRRSYVNGQSYQQGQDDGSKVGVRAAVGGQGQLKGFLK